VELEFGNIAFFFWREENPLPEDIPSEKGENQQQAQPGKA